MTLRQSINIRASRERVWKYVADPAQWPSWNPKLAYLRRTRSGPLVSGEQFSSRWRLKRREEDNEMIVRGVEEKKKIQMEQHFHYKNRVRVLGVTFELEETGHGVKFSQTIDHSRSGIPFVFQGLMWAIFKFGRPVGKPMLTRLKELAEGE